MAPDSPRPLCLNEERWLPDQDPVV